MVQKRKFKSTPEKKMKMKIGQIGGKKKILKKNGGKKTIKKKNPSKPKRKSMIPKVRIWKK